MTHPMLGPVVALAGWTLVVLVILVARRFPALKALGVDLSRAVGGRGGDLEGRVAPRVQWPAHNYAHLVEQPTLFYAIALALAVGGDRSTVSVGLAWTYVALRVAHSLWQIAVNIVRIRLLIFATATLVLAALVVRAAMLVL